MAEIDVEVCLDVNSPFGLVYKVVAAYKNFKGGLTTIPEYQNLMPAMDQVNFDRLKENIRSDGVIREPIVVDGNTIVDGHNRYKIASMLDMKFETIQKHFQNTDEGRLWIAQNQIGRRKMSKGQLTVLALEFLPHFEKIMLDRKRQAGKTRGRGQKEIGATVSKGETAAGLVAAEFGVGVNSVKDLKTLVKNTPGIKELVKTNVLKVSEAKTLIEMSKKKDSQFEVLVEGKLTEKACKCLDKIRRNRDKGNKKKTESDSMAFEAKISGYEAVKKAGKEGAKTRAENKKNVTEHTLEYFRNYDIKSYFEEVTINCECSGIYKDRLCIFDANRSKTLESELLRFLMCKGNNVKVLLKEGIFMIYMGDDIEKFKKFCEMVN